MLLHFYKWALFKYLIYSLRGRSLDFTRLLRKRDAFFVKSFARSDGKAFYEFEDVEELPLISWRIGTFYARQAARIFFFPLLWNLG
jgi:hypothetical protein